jgi:hypothetical protein
MTQVSPTVEHNLHMLQIHPNWYDHLPKVEAAMAEEDRISTARYDAGWDGDEGGSYSPDGIHENDWEEMGRPFPENEIEYVAWFFANNSSDCNPYPKRQARLEQKRRVDEYIAQRRAEREAAK